MAKIGPDPQNLGFGGPNWGVPQKVGVFSFKTPFLSIFWQKMAKKVTFECETPVFGAPPQLGTPPTQLWGVRAIGPSKGGPGALKKG